MMRIKLIILLLLISLSGFAKEVNDTINVVINLSKVDSSGLKINVYPSSDLKGVVKYIFPKSIPGMYEYLKNCNTFITLKQGKSEINCEENTFLINSNLDDDKITYYAKSTVGRYNGISAEDTYYLKDSVYILNWHYLVGYFNNNFNRPYKIEIIKKSKLLGIGSLFKKEINDSTDIYIAKNYKDLIHSPLMYCIPDTTNFKIGKTNFVISYAGADTSLNSKKIKNLIYKPLAEIYNKSTFKHKEYTFIYFSKYSLSIPYFVGLEHPNSTLICYHSALLNNNILISSSIHEYIHSIYAPLRIRSEIINEFDFNNPKCDKFLWFYEGVTEYLAINTLVKSGFFKPKDFFNELEESDEYYRNINFNKVSLNIYGKKGEELFDNFYTKGSLFAMLLDLEIIKRSEGKTDLFDVMQNLQGSFNPENPFNSKTFIKDFTTASGVNIYNFIVDNTSTNKKIKYSEIIELAGFKKEFTDTLIWSFKPRKTYQILNYKKNRLEIALFGSTINKKLKSKKVIIYEINGKPLTWYNCDLLLNPNSGNKYSFKADVKNKTVDITAVPDRVLKEKYHLNWVRNKNIDTEVTKRFWKK